MSCETFIEIGIPYVNEHMMISTHKYMTIDFSFPPAGLKVKMGALPFIGFMHGKREREKKERREEREREREGSSDDSAVLIRADETRR